MARSSESLRAAGTLVRDGCPDDAASRAYYAAFYAASALLASLGKDFAKHSGVRAAFHRDIVRSGQLDAALGKSYDLLWNLRTLGDYGRIEHVSQDMAAKAVAMATDLVKAVRDLMDKGAEEAADSDPSRPESG